VVLEGERTGDGLARAARRRPDRHAVVRKMPAQLPAGELGQRAPRGAQLDELVLLLLLAADALELVGELLDAQRAREALQLDVALRRLALDRQRICKQLGKCAWQQSCAHIGSLRTNLGGRHYAQ
jgi:hypothetical protein